MPYQISRLLDEMPKGRIRKAQTDRYAALKHLLEQVPEGKTAQVPMQKADYRAFSAGIRAAGVQAGKKATVAFKSGSAYVSWVPLTDENRPKLRGRRRTVEESGPSDTALPVIAPSAEVAQEVEEMQYASLDDDIDPRLVGDLEGEVSPDVALFQQQARRTRRQP